MDKSKTVGPGVFDALFMFCACLVLAAHGGFKRCATALGRLTLQSTASTTAQGRWASCGQAATSATGKCVLSLVNDTDRTALNDTARSARRDFT